MQLLASQYSEEYFTPFVDSCNLQSNCVYVVLPCYNEEENLSQLINNIISELNGASFEIIAVDDGSSDSSISLLESLSNKYPIHIIRHKKNRGLSSTLKDGLLYASALARPNDAIITMDADNTHNAQYIHFMLKALDQGAEIVIASRYYGGGSQVGVPKNRILLSKAANYFINCLTGLKVKDSTSGYRCYKASVLKKAEKEYNSNFINSKGFEVQVELLVKLGRIANKINEIPFKLRYDKKNGKSKMSLMHTILNYVLLSFKIISWRKNKSHIFKYQFFGNGVTDKK